MTSSRSEPVDDELFPDPLVSETTLYYLGGCSAGFLAAGLDQVRPGSAPPEGILGAGVILFLATAFLMWWA